MTMARTKVRLFETCLKSISNTETRFVSLILFGPAAARRAAASWTARPSLFGVSVIQDDNSRYVLEADLKLAGEVFDGYDMGLLAEFGIGDGDNIRHTAGFRLLCELR